MKVVWNMKAIISVADFPHSDVKPDLLLFFFDEAGGWQNAKRCLTKSFSTIVKPNSQLFGPNSGEEN